MSNVVAKLNTYIDETGKLVSYKGSKADAAKRLSFLGLKEEPKK